MYYWKTHIIKTIGIIGIVVLNACTYTTQGTKLTSINPSPPETQPTIEHTVGDFSFTLDGGKMVSSNLIGKSLSEQIVDAWKEKKYIKEAQYVDNKNFSGNANYNVTLSGTQHGESSIAMQIISGISLFLIPYSVTQHYDLQYTLSEPKTGNSFSASVQESNKTYVELFLLFALPFAQDGQKSMMENISDHLYDQLYRQGAFQKEPIQAD